MENPSYPHQPAGFDRLYHIYHTIFHYDYHVMDSDKRQLFHVDNSSLTPKKPDLTFHAGTTTQAPVVSVGKFLHFSRHFKIGLGNPQHPNTVVWEDLVCQGFAHVKHTIQVTTRSNKGATRRSFVWKKTSSVGVAGSTPSLLGNRNYKLVDESGKIAAIFTQSSYSYKKAGKLEVCADYGQGFDLMVLTTALCLFESQRRRSNSSSGGGGGGGGA